uniref:high mobility group B protein 3-like n=1 Tax=Erigeron canadensis TaxID=72917 RepID=UPI001CB92678|nr:high mobility group B protein 3-like [Erigeron canadensis]
MRGPKNTATVAQKTLTNPTATTLMTKKTKSDKTTAAKKTKADKNSGAPKRPQSAFFIFMQDFRKEYMEKHPDNKTVSVVAKEGGAKWKCMSESEKAPYVAKATTKKEEYGIAVKQFNFDLNEAAKEKSASTSKSSVDTNDDVGQEASSI